MQITHISVRDFQAVKHVDIDVDRPVLFLCGENEQGKSSLIDGIKLALTGTVDRVQHKKDWAHLIREGSAKGAQIEVTIDSGRAQINLPSGSAKREGTPAVTEALVSAFSPSWFAKLVPDDRRAFLFPLLGIATDAEAIAARIIARGANEAKLKTLQPLMGRATWEAIAADAKAMATKAKGAWQQITGESWGSTKAAGWIPTAPDKPREGSATGERQAAARLQEQIDAANQRIGTLTAAQKMLALRGARLTELAEIVENISRRKKALATATAERDAMEQSIAGVQQIVAGQPLGTECECPECGSILLLEGKTLRALPVGGSPHSPDDIAEAKQALQRYNESLIMLRKAEANAKRDLDATAAAQLERERLLGEEIEEIDAGDIERYRTDIAEMRARAAKHLQAVEQFTAYDKAIANAAKSRDDAAVRHRDVTEWLEIAELVGPSGVPGELLTAGLDKINSQLAALAARAGWDAPVVRDDMTLLIGTRPYGLGSVSAQYRAYVLCSIAIAMLSGLQFVVLDGIEVLVGPQRLALLKLVHWLVTECALQTVILGGTLKEPPAKLPATYRAVWIEAGEVVAQGEAEKAAA